MGRRQGNFVIPSHIIGINRGSVNDGAWRPTIAPDFLSSSHPGTRGQDADRSPGRGPHETASRAPRAPNFDDHRRVKQSAIPAEESPSEWLSRNSIRGGGNERAGRTNDTWTAEAAGTCNKPLAAGVLLV
jgi:hypothetical protein